MSTGKDSINNKLNNSSTSSKKKRKKNRDSGETSDTVGDDMTKKNEPISSNDESKNINNNNNNDNSQHESNKVSQNDVKKTVNDRNNNNNNNKKNSGIENDDDTDEQLVKTKTAAATSTSTSTSTSTDIVTTAAATDTEPPVLVVSNDIVSDITFKELGLVDVLCEACTILQWKTATQIQKEVLPEALVGRDVIGLAETGSGKTGAFVLPMLQLLLLKPIKQTSALILTPTRELAFQIHHVVQALGQTIGANSTCIVGGVDRTSQAICLARNPHIIIATPGRLLDHLKDTKGFHLRHVRYLVLDEADRMLSMDFEEELHQILDQIQQNTSNTEQKRQTMLFSATMTNQVQKLQRASLIDPVRVEVNTKFQTPKQLLQYYMFIPAKYKDCYFTYLVNNYSGQSMLVFAATCNNVQRLTLLLRNLGFPAVCLHGQMNQSKRSGSLQKFASGQRSILVCTDVASRGLDLPDVDLVINYDLPSHGKEYIHRVGRTARAGKSGNAIALVTQYDVEIYQRIESLLGKKLPEYTTDEDTVLILLERVNEAQRLATRELKEQNNSGNNGRNGKRGRRTNDRFNGDDNDNDDGNDMRTSNNIKQQFYAGGSGGQGGALHNQRGGHKKSGSNTKKHKR